MTPSPRSREEVDNVSEYIAIKKAALSGPDSVSLRCDSSCLSLRVPLFSLQPLVENALLHSLEPKKEGDPHPFRPSAGRFIVVGWRMTVWEVFSGFHRTDSRMPSGSQSVRSDGDRNGKCDPAIVRPLRPSVPTGP